MNRQLDGVITEDESRKLREYLSKNDEAQREYADLVKMAQALGHVEEAQPPSCLKNHILNSIRRTPIPQRTPTGLIASLVEILGHRSFTRYALVFVSGLCIGILLFVLTNPWREGAGPDASRVSGSATLFPDISNLAPIDSARVEEEGIDAVFRTYRDAGRVAVELSVSSPEAITVELNSDPVELKFGGIGRMTGSEGEVSVTQGKIRFMSITNNRCIVTFIESGQTRRALEGRVYKGARIVQSKTLRIW
jgi:anti-sigma factor RsiW